MRKSVFWFSFVLVFLWLKIAPGTIINVPGNYSTIQLAIDNSFDGDTVLVQPNTYYENVDYDGHNIVLGSLFLTTGDTSYIATTVIDGNHSGSVISFLNEEDSTAIITGFTIQNGQASFGGGIYCENSSPKINYNIISGNSAQWDGGGIFCDNSNPTINHNTINGNSAAWGGGGIFCDFSNPAIYYNTISGNSADDGGGIVCSNGAGPMISRNTISGNSADYGGGGLYCYESSPTIIGNVISGNSIPNFGGGIYCYDSDLTICNNTISENTAGFYGGGFWCWDSSPAITNTIFWADSAPTGPEIYLYGTSSPVITYCDVQDTLWPGQGNIAIDPLFRDPINSDFHLTSIACGDTADSPCIDAGDPTICDLILNCNWGLGDRRSDMGAYGGGINCSEIPTLSEWGMLIMALLLLAAGTVAVARRRRAAVAEKK